MTTEKYDPSQNLKRDGSKPGRKVRRRPRISYDKYTEMYLVFRETLSAEQVAKRCGISPTTARRWIEEGRPDIGWPALTVRYKREMEKLNKKTERTAALVRAENLNLLAKMKSDLFKSYVEKMKAQNNEALAKDWSLKNFIQIVRAEMLCLGITDESKQKAGEIDPKDPSTWSDAMLAEFMKTGRIPSGRKFGNQYTNQNNKKE